MIIRTVAALYIGDKEVSERKPCKLDVVFGKDGQVHLDRDLEFPCDQSGTGTVRFFDQTSGEFVMSLGVEGYLGPGCSAIVRRSLT